MVESIIAQSAFVRVPKPGDRPVSRRPTDRIASPALWYRRMALPVAGLFPLTVHRRLRVRATLRGRCDRWSLSTLQRASADSVRIEARSGFPVFSRSRDPVPALRAVSLSRRRVARLGVGAGDDHCAVLSAGARDLLSRIRSRMAAG